MISSNSPSILTFQLKHIGDAILSLPALGLIKKRRPGARTGLVLQPGPASLLRGHPWVDELFVYAYESGHSGRTCALVRELRHRRFETALIFDAKNRSSFAARLAGCRKVFGGDAVGRIWGWPKSLLYTRQISLPWQSSDSIARRYQMFTGEALGLASEPALSPLAPPLQPEAALAAQKLLAELPGRGPKIGLGPFGIWPGKLWPLECFAELAARLHKKLGARLFVTGVAGDVPSAARLRELSGVPIADFCGRTSLPELLALAAASDLFIGIDSGTAHIAALAGIPQIVIFVSTPVGIWAPQNPRARILCYDKLFDECGALRNGPWEIFPEVSPELVFETAVSMLG